MAWVTPSTRSANDLITDTIWNQDVVDNPTALKAQLDGLASPVGDDYYKIVSSVAETTIGTFTVTAGGMGDDGFIHLYSVHRVYNNDGAARTARFRHKFGATTVFDSGAVSHNFGAVYGFWKIHTWVFNTDATGTQISVTHVAYCTGQALSGMRTATVNMYSENAAIDTTAAVTLAVTVELGVASVNFYSESISQYTGEFNP